MSNKKETGGGIAKYFIGKEGEVDKRRTTTDPSRMFQMNRMEGTGQGEAGPTHDATHDTKQSTTQYDPKTGKQSQNEMNDASQTKKDANVYVYGGTKGDRKRERDARLGPQKCKSPQKTTPSDDEVTWGTFPSYWSKEEAKLEQEGGVASNHVPEEDGVASMGASWRAAEVWGDPTRTQVPTREGTKATCGGLVKTTSKRKDKTGKGEEEPTRRRKEKDGIKILYINAGKHERAVEEVSRIH